MDIKEIKQIVDMMKRSDLTEFEIEEKDLKLRICREGGSMRNKGETTPPIQMVASPQPLQVSAPAAPAPIAAPAQAKAPETAGEPEGTFIKSPMVGTFYRAPSPDSPAFVEVGAKVTPESTVCIIEAMKVMNEIQAELSGEIAEILIENGEPVEYGQKIFKLK